MQLIMAGIDYKTADVEIREQLSFTSSTSCEAMMRIKAENEISGCVILSTCNRTEIYISSESDELDPVELICNIKGISANRYREFFTVRSGRSVAMHLMMVSAGLRSQVRGEDQILTQVKSAVYNSREVKSCDAVLETLFRCSISASKKAKTLFPLSPVESSIVARGLSVLNSSFGKLDGKKVLVIGNGEMGRLAATTLLNCNCDITMTLRSYKRGQANIPDNCKVIAYDDRYSIIAEMDIVISATTSPHYTIRTEELDKLGKLNLHIVDLAVPRDIEPSAMNISGIKGWNVDTLGGNYPSEDSINKINSIKDIINEYMLRFEKWHSFRSLMQVSKEQK